MHSLSKMGAPVEMFGAVQHIILDKFLSTISLPQLLTYVCTVKLLFFEVPPIVTIKAQ